MLRSGKIFIRHPYQHRTRNCFPAAPYCAALPCKCSRSLSTRRGQPRRTQSLFIARLIEHTGNKSDHIGHGVIVRVDHLRFRAAAIDYTFGLPLSVAARIACVYGLKIRPVCRIIRCYLRVLGEAVHLINQQHVISNRFTAVTRLGAPICSR